MSNGPSYFARTGQSAIGAGVDSISELTIGADANGVVDYLDQIHSVVIKDVGELLDSTNDLVAAIQDGWVGTSRDRFVNQFLKTKDDIKEDLISEYTDLTQRIYEITAGYFKQDQNLIDENI